MIVRQWLQALVRDGSEAGDMQLVSISTFGITFYSLKCWIASVKLLVRALLLCHG